MIIDNEPIEYVLKKEQGKESAVIFLIKPANTRLSNKLANLLKVDASGEVVLVKCNLGDIRQITLEECLVGWKNLKNKKGELVEFKKELIGDLPSYVNIELYKEIGRISKPTEEEIKN